MTLDGTNSYVIDAGGGAAIVVDPGPPIESHLDAIGAAAEALDAKITAIAVTLGHPDHAPGAAPLAARTGAPVYAHRDARFPHDRELADGDLLRVGDTALRVIEAPGHARDHVVFWLEDEKTLFTGDVVLGMGTVVIAPPGGDMRAYQATLDRLRRDFSGASAILGGHGERVGDPLAKLDAYIAHRKSREREVLDALESGPQTIPALVKIIYAGVSRVLWPAASRQVLAYLIALEREGRISHRALERAATADERAILEPDLSKIADPASRAVANAELGYDEASSAIEEYALR
ncbi:MAG: MBL fold metallo-hydrolase [Candidatus Eremiobacteraeota bacterium]|nr:MBL fold metallo-hydrolase [Candidatus Eremiobacteraeota bacterium]